MEATTGGLCLTELGPPIIVGQFIRYATGRSEAQRLSVTALGERRPCGGGGSALAHALRRHAVGHLPVPEKTTSAFLIRAPACTGYCDLPGSKISMQQNVQNRNG